MPFQDALSYFVTVIAIGLAPGPCSLILLVKAAGRDVPGALAFGLGIALGGVAIVAAVCFGMGHWLEAVPAVFDVGPWLMLGFVLYLAARLWTGLTDLTARADVPRRPPLASLTAGILSVVISPYYMVLFPITLPNLMNVTEIALPEFAVAASLTFGALSAGQLLIVVFAARIARMAASPRAVRRLNRGLAGLLVAAGTALAFG